MPRSLTILIAEDSATDAELLLRELRRAGFEPAWHRVDSEAEYLAQLHGGLDLVLSDFEMPQFSGFRALELLKQSGLDVPFILVSGTIGEDTAVEAMKLGASDYLLKDRLARLGKAVEHSLEQSGLRRQRRHAIEALSESEGQMKLLLAHAPAAIAMLDTKMRYLICSRRWMADYGMESRPVTGCSHYEIFPEIPERWKEIHRRCLAGAVERSEADEFVRLDGSRQWVRWEIHPWYSAPTSVGGIVIFSEDITARKEGEFKLRESEERFRQLAENINEVFWMTDPAKNAMLYISPAYEAIWGRTCESLYQRPRNWLEAIHPDDRDRVLKAATDQQSQGVYEETYRIVRPDGALRWIHDRAYPIKNELGQVYRVAGTAMDITGQKEMETQLLQMQRMESVGRLAGGIAHDLNNILAPILMGAPLMRMGLPPAQMERTLTTIESSARRGADLVKQLLMFGRGFEGQRMLVRMKDLVREMEEIMRETFPKNIAIASGVPADIWPLMGDATQLHQVLINLCVNARDAMPHGGELTIAARNLIIDENYASMSPEAKPGNYVCLSVADTGTGIPPAIVDKIFDPFFTTKEIGEGTGLGLSTLIGIVKNHGGFVTVSSEVNKGTLFQIHLPAKPEAKNAAAEPDAKRSPMGRGETILLVDDEPGIRETTGTILEQSGYRVLLSSDGADACAQFALHLSEIDIVLTDIDMPVMGGVAMIRVLKKMKPAVKIIISSGKAPRLADKSLQAALDELQVGSILTKPYSAERILHALHDMLAGK